MEFHHGESEVLLETKFHRTDLLQKGCSSLLFVDLHPQKPWVLFAPVHSNSLQVWNYEDGTRVASWQIPARDYLLPQAAKFIAQKDWIIVRGTYDFKVYEFKPRRKLQDCHVEALRTPRKDSMSALAVHHSATYVLTAFYDGSIMLWDWSSERGDITTLKGHSKCVNCLAFHPTDLSVFAASEVSMIKVWDMETKSVSQTLGDDCKTDMTLSMTLSMEFHRGLEKSLLIMGHHDYEVRVWDYNSVVCVVQLGGHTGWAMSAFFHPNLPYIFSASIDGEITVWRESDYDLVAVNMPSGLVGKLWCMAPCGNSNKLILGGKGELKVLEVVVRVSETDDPTAVLRKKMEELETEAVRAFTKKTEQAVASVERKYRKKLEEMRAEHWKTERAQADRVKQLEEEIRNLKSESSSAAKRIQELESEVQNMIAERKAMAR
ncbi:hypothetical protein CBR_g37412 [Chara braunii]|uniref:Uncharacterized protein n=1 Tax=Chara braunii TaxID=69332 RepID=A0A388LMR3_CHABU|nr:hypothetical protein CBR_g37412 [Chara braunii]|eukprot:GBG83608.1 hypothetical protein CBR_g37412 [Chara braunii]